MSIKATIPKIGNKNLPRLSYWKKRTAALNKATGFKFSPTKLARMEAAGIRYSAEDDISEAIFNTIESLPDPRGKGAKAQTAKIYSDFTINYWRKFAETNAFTRNVIEGVEQGNAYIQGNAIYLVDESAGVLELRKNTRTGVERVPAGAQKLTLKLANDLIKRVAHEATKQRRSHPLYGGYDDLEP